MQSCFQPDFYLWSTMDTGTSEDEKRCHKNFEGGHRKMKMKMKMNFSSWFFLKSLLCLLKKNQNLWMCAIYWFSAELHFQKEKIRRKWDLEHFFRLPNNLLVPNTLPLETYKIRCKKLFLKLSMWYIQWFILN